MSPESARAILALIKLAAACFVIVAFGAALGAAAAVAVTAFRWIAG